MVFKVEWRIRATESCLATVCLGLARQTSSWPKEFDFELERRAVQARPLTNGRFIPLVFSAGEMMSEATRKELETWGREAGSEHFPEDEDDGKCRLAQGQDKEF